MSEIDEKINRYIKIYPYLSGMSDDLMFWAAFNTIFLTTVKNLSAADINSIMAISLFFSIILKNPLSNIIKRVGNVNSIKIGLFCFLFSAFFLTVGKTYVVIALGEIFHQFALLFKGMDAVVLKRDLKYLNREDEFVKIQSRGTMVYAIATMVVSFICGFMFNIDTYLPMYACLTVCLLTIIASRVIIEFHYVDPTQIVKEKVNWTKILIGIVLFYGLIFSIVESIQDNSKILMQYYMGNYLDTAQIAIKLSFIIALSRISRVLANLTFSKIYKIMGKRIILFLNSLVLLATLAIILGYHTENHTIGLVLMGFGFCLILGSRDPLTISLKTELLNRCRREEQEEAMVNFNICKKLFRCIITTLISLILLKLKLIQVFFIILFCAVAYLIFAFKLCNTLEQ